MTELSSRYNPQETESKWEAVWEKNRVYHAEPNPKKPPFTIVIPPPNITGILHMGHALNNTLQDILIRYKRMQGFEALWMPGIDHAGIATQNVVEKQLAKEGRKRQDLGREEFLKRLWAWRNEYGNTIIHQLKKLGSSCDWDRTAFTMDPGYSAAVRLVFVKLFEKGLIYRGQYIINWCPRCQTALSDEEAEHKETKGALYHLRYPLKDDPNQSIIVATTRPETMLGDTAVAVNPKDKRYKKLIGKNLMLPLMNREIKVIADPLVDPKFGTGAVKVTPAHDPNDFEMGMRHHLEFINIMHPDARINERGGNFSGLDRFVARKKIIETLKEQNLLEKIEDHTHAVGHCYRCNTVVEPYLSKQWFVKMQPLAKPALEAVKKGKIKFYPARWTKVYTTWMENIRDWCISRQIWWGHRIPVWTLPLHAPGDFVSKKLLEFFEEFGVEKNAVVIKNDFKENEFNIQICTANDNAAVAIKNLNAFYQIGTFDHHKTESFPTHKARELAKTIMAGPAAGQVIQDSDVLDTWFSSWLWPFATFGWPKKNPDLDYFYPTGTLITAAEIIFFWVARMIMAGIEFMGDIPFSDVYIHGTVRDAKGQKMSKSLGNSIDPLEIINEYGADALRFSLILNSGQDLFISKEKFEIGRNFANKIWNASRLILMNTDQKAIRHLDFSKLKSTDLDFHDRWIISSFHSTLQKVGPAIEKYRNSEAESLIYDFFWGYFCDWYLEIIKDRLQDQTTKTIAVHLLGETLKILHPFMPFISEEIWHQMDDQHKTMALESWPQYEKKRIDKEIEKKMVTLIRVVTSIRNLRAQWNISAAESIDAVFSIPQKDNRSFIEENSSLLRRLLKIKELDILAESKSIKQSASGIVDNIKFFIPLSGIIDIQKEKDRISRQIEEQTTAMNNLSQRLKNPEFRKKAPPEVIEKENLRLQSLQNKLSELKKILKELD